MYSDSVIYKRWKYKLKEDANIFRFIEIIFVQYCIINNYYLTVSVYGFARAHKKSN